MRRILVLLAAVAAMAALAVPVALAQSPHFIRANATVNNDGNLRVSWKEAELGDNQLISYVASADGTATYVCVSGGGVQNKTTVAGPVSAEGGFNSRKNGRITASLTMTPPPSDISCPPGQSLELAQVTYTNVSITDTWNGITQVIAGTFSSGCLLPRVQGACD